MGAAALAAAASCAAQEAADSSTEESYIDQAQRALSDDIVQTGRWLDGLFGAEGYGPVGSGGSLLRVGVTSDLRMHPERWEPNVQARVALPRTQERFDLYLENRVERAFDDDGELSEYHPEDIGGYAETADPEEETEYIAGLRYVDEVADFLNFRADAGAVVRWPPNTFVRARLRKSYFSGDWQIRIGETFFWSADKGRGASTEMTWQHPMGQGYFFRSDTETTYLERKGTFFHEQDFIISRRLGRDEGIAYRFGARSRGQPKPLDQIIYDFRYRCALYKRWLLMEIRPAATFAREEGYRLKPHLYLTFEVLFGDRDEYGH